MQVECDSTIEQFGGRTNIERWIPQLTTDVLFCADANLNGKTGICKGDSGGPAVQRFVLKLIVYVVAPSKCKSQTYLYLV